MDLVERGDREQDANRPNPQQNAEIECMYHHPPPHNDTTIRWMDGFSRSSSGSGPPVYPRAIIIPIHTNNNGNNDVALQIFGEGTQVHSGFLDG